MSRRKSGSPRSFSLGQKGPRGSGLFSCEVLDPLGTPLRGAEITVYDKIGHKWLMNATSDPFGHFTASLMPGDYSVVITADSLEPVRASITVAENQRTELNAVTLQPSPVKELPEAGTWVFDPPHTSIRFVAQHVGMANVHGRFTSFDGGVHIGRRIEDSHLEISIDAASITTGNRTRDSHLRSPDFLDVAVYPSIEFTSDRFVHRHGSKWTVEGSLSLHGISRTVQLDTNYLGMVNGGYERELRCAATATAELHREDYTLNWRQMLARGIAVVGPRIRLEIDVQVMFQGPDTPTPPR
jgi:polyisoprenoid-binding protein YceI